jgi:predicted metal-dependent phosphoesterase TrpH
MDNIGGPIIRAVTHIHTKHSWDSRSDIPSIAELLVAHGCGLALITDHNSFRGSTEMRSYVREHGLPLEVPLAAELRTDRGDVVVVLPGDEPPNVEELLTWASLPEKIHSEGGVVWLPHPFRGHSDVNEVAEHSDVIEVFNARCSPEQDAMAVELCRRLGKVPAYGADAHRLKEVGAVIVEYDRCASAIETLLGEPRCRELVRSLKSDIMAAEVANGVKRRRPALVGYFGLRWVKHRMAEIRRSGTRR